MEEAIKIIEELRDRTVLQREKEDDNSMKNRYEERLIAYTIAIMTLKITPPNR